MPDYEMGREALKRLIEEVSGSVEADSQRNEASTRFHIIDILFNDVLGWPKSVIKVEHRAERGISDYELGSPACLVVEAKREGAHFDLPVGWTKPQARLETLFSASDEIKMAVHQATNYAQERGIPFAAICNGRQLIVLTASRSDGVPPLEGNAIVFSSLEDMLSRFRDLWEALSPPAITAGNLFGLLAAGLLPPPPKKLSGSIVGYPGYKNRNPIATDLQILGGLFLEDISRMPGLEEEFLAETYCPSGSLSQYALVSRELLQARYATAFEKEGQFSAMPVMGKKGVAEGFSQDVFAASLSKRPILLVGDVGVGKSMFIRHFIKVEAKKELDRALVLYIDFGSRPALVDDLRPYVAGEIVRQLDEKYGIDVYERQFVRGVYHGRLRKFSESIFADLKDIDPTAFRQKEVEFLEKLTADTEEHLKNCFHHAVEGQRRQIVLFLDNVDQRPPQFQEEVFLIAQAFSESWPLTAFVSLRPETFVQSRASGALSAYQPRIFTIDPPRVDQVLARRLAFAKKRLLGTGRLPWLPSGLTFHSQNLLNYIDILIRACEENSDIVEFVDNMSAGNIRRALDFIAAFVGSAHVDSTKLLEIERSGGYTLPLHEFLRAVTYGDCEHYDPAKSPVTNVFDISARDGHEHFLLGLLIGFVEQAGQVGGKEGYVERDKVLGYAQELGFKPSQICVALKRALDKGLLSTPSGLREDDSSRLRITTIGAYTVKKLMSSFGYLDAMIVDTPIVDPNVRNRIGDESYIEGRLDRAMIVIDYLDAQWRSVTRRANECLDWPRLSLSVRKQIEEIRKRIEGRR